MKKIALVLIIIIISYTALLPDYKSFNYISRTIRWGDSDVLDYLRFPSREIAQGSEIFQFAYEPKVEYINALLKDITYAYKGKLLTIADANKFFEASDTTAFIIIKDDKVLYEKYFNGYNRESINTSFSVAKSVTSFLIGKAVEEGYIKSIDEPITNYIPELKNKGFAKITIKNLLMMSSGISYKEGRLFLGDDAQTYYSPNLRRLALEETKLADLPGDKFLYNNYNPLLLGVILERTTDTNVAEYLQAKLWKPIGMEFSASWSIDSNENGLEKMESGINARAIDYAKLGRLYLQKGSWNGKQIISEEWIIDSTMENEEQPREHYYSNYKNRAFFQSDNGYYKYMWWGYKRDKEDYDFFAYGKYGQIIYISPKNNVIIVRNGITTGKVDWWPEILYKLASKII